MARRVRGPRVVAVATAAVLALGALAAVGCGHASPHAQHPAPPRDRLAAIRVEGNRAIPEADLTGGLALRRDSDAGRAVDDYQVAIDATRIAGAYQRHGYFSVVVTSRLVPGPTGTTVVFTVVEGKRATTRVEVLGLPADLPAMRARGLVEIAEGAPFDYDAYDAAKAPLAQLLADAGYARATVTAEVYADRTDARATIRFTIDAGPKCTFGAIELAGVDGELADAVRARVAFKPGQQYSASAVAATQQALYAMGRFTAARVEPDRSGDGAVIPVKIGISLGNRHEARASVGFGLDPVTYQPRLGGGYQVAGWPTPLITTGIEMKLAYAILREGCGWDFWTCEYDPRVRLIGTVVRQDLWRTNLEGRVEGGLDYLTLEAYRITSERVRLGLATPLGKHVQARVGWQLAEQSFSHLDPAIDVATAERLGLGHDNGSGGIAGNTLRLGAYTQALVVDLRDHPLEPTEGVYAEVRVAEGSRYAGGELTYLQVTPELRTFLPLGTWVAAARARFGGIFGDVPVSERYYGGGLASHRGFPERRLSPVASQVVDGELRTTPIGGAGLIDTAFELRVPLPDLWGIPLGALGFLDGGDVTDTVDELELDPAKLHWAAGLGLRVRTPIGPLGMAVAYRLNRTGPGEPEAGHHFNYLITLGESF